MQVTTVTWVTKITRVIRVYWVTWVTLTTRVKRFFLSVFSQQLQFLFELPSRLHKCVEMRQYGLAVR